MIEHGMASASGPWRDENENRGEYTQSQASG